MIHPDRFCLTDIGGPFYDPARPFRNWSALPFYQLDLPHMPYVATEQLEWGLERALAYLDVIHAQGYNGIVIDNMAHLVTFDQAPERVYTPNSPFRLRALIYADAFGRLFDAARVLGMDVFVTTDMQWSTPPVRRLLGKLLPGDARLAALNSWAVEELFTRFPQVRGLFVRVGEAGGAHNQGSDYAGHMIYRTPQELRGLINTLLPICERFDRLLVLRTWSIGIDELGDLMWSPERYQAAVAGYTSPHLLVSVKHGPSDFFRWLEHNPTLGQAGPAQLIELQNRREYELFGMVPSAVVPLHQEVLQQAAANRQYAGVWAWNCSGGWGGGTAALGESGMSVWTELSSALTAALVRTPDLDAAALTHAWCAERFGAQSREFAAAVAELYLDSGAVFEQSWYCGALPNHCRNIGALYLPTLLWVWWMRPTVAAPVWAYLASAVGDVEAVLQRGAEALERLRVHAERVARLAAPDDPEARFVAESARYLLDCMVMAQAIRTLMLPLFAAVRAQDRVAWNRLVRREVRPLRMAIRSHRIAWEGRTDFPALELDEVTAFLRVLPRAEGGFWLRARAANALVERLRTGTFPKRSIYTAGVLAAAGLGLALLRRRSRRTALGALASGLLASRFRHRAFGRALPWLSRRYYLLPSIFFETGPAFTEWAE